MDWLDLLAVQGTLKSLLQHHSSKASMYGVHTVPLNGECWLTELGKSHVSGEQGIKALKDGGKGEKDSYYQGDSVCSHCARNTFCDLILEKKIF